MTASTIVWRLLSFDTFHGSQFFHLLRSLRQLKRGCQAKASPYLLVLHARARKLGDALVFAKTVSDFERFDVESVLTLRSRVVLIPEEMRTPASFVLKNLVWYRSDVQMIFLGVLIKAWSLLDGKSIVFVNLTGESGAAKTLRTILSPRAWATRSRDLAFGRVGGENRALTFEHSSQFEYCEGPLRILYPNFRSSRCLSIAPVRSLLPVRKRLGILVSPFSAERRRSLTLEAAIQIIRESRDRGTISIMFDPSDSDQSSFVSALKIAAPPSEGLTFSPLLNKHQVWRALRRSEELICVDSGIYVLASLTGMRIRVLYGPTQPGKTQYNRSIPAVIVRDPRLGGHHCGVTRCQRSWCIDSALGLLVESRSLPAGCHLLTPPT